MIILQDRLVIFIWFIQKIIQIILKQNSYVKCIRVPQIRIIFIEEYGVIRQLKLFTKKKFTGKNYLI